MESIAVAKAIQRKHKDYDLLPNQELIGLGIANIGGAFLQAFPTTGGFSRTAVNDQSGAKTGMASIISALLIVLTLLFLTPLFYYLPNAILAAIIMVAVFGLIDYKEAIHLWKSYRPDFWMLAATFVATLALGIEEGVLIGVVLSLAMVIYRISRPHIAELAKTPEGPHYRNIARFEHLQTRDDMLIVRFDARLHYANANYFLEKINNLMEQKPALPKLLILDADSINGIDSTGIHALEDLMAECQSKQIRFYIVGLKGPIRDILRQGGFFDKMGEDNLFLRIQHAVDNYDKKDHNRYTEYTLQTN